jgi:hypothetical protein
LCISITQFIEKDEMQVDAELFPTVIEYEFDDALPQLKWIRKGLIASIKFMSGFCFTVTTLVL